MLEQTRRRLDVGEEKGDRPDRQLRHERYRASAA
jgi:hypothetical protein